MVWYADGLILTCMEEQKMGRQIIINNDKVIGVSYPKNYPPNSYGVGLRHEYNWGYVGTTEGYQMVCVSNKSLWRGSQTHFQVD